MNRKQDEREKIIKKLTEAGMKVRKGRKKPKNGVYSGIINKKSKVLKLNI